MIYLNEIEQIEEKYQKKKNHFYVKLKNGSGMHLKCDNQKDANNWVKSLKMLLSVYKDKKLVDFDIDRKYKDKVDIRVSNMIMKEIESKYFTKIFIK